MASYSVQPADPGTKTRERKKGGTVTKRSDGSKTIRKTNKSGARVTVNKNAKGKTTSKTRVKTGGPGGGYKATTIKRNGTKTTTKSKGMGSKTVQTKKKADGSSVKKIHGKGGGTTTKRTTADGKTTTKKVTAAQKQKKMQRRFKKAYSSAPRPTTGRKPAPKGRKAIRKTA